MLKKDYFLNHTSAKYSGLESNFSGLLEIELFFGMR